jgi:hypothetical protein
LKPKANKNFHRRTGTLYYYFNDHERADEEKVWNTCGLGDQLALSGDSECGGRRWYSVAVRVLEDRGAWRKILTDSNRVGLLV